MGIEKKLTLVLKRKCRMWVVLAHIWGFCGLQKEKYHTRAFQPSIPVETIIQAFQASILMGSVTYFSILEIIQKLCHIRAFQLSILIET